MSESYHPIQKMGRGIHRNPPQGMKWCAGCQLFVRIEFFHKNRSAKDGLQTKCKQHAKSNTYDYERERDKQLRINYGITLEEYNALLASQDGVCAACGNPATHSTGRNKRTNAPPVLAVDHDHATGKVRGLLCNGCNISLGLLQDDPERIKALLQYILSRQNSP